MLVVHANWTGGALRLWGESLHSYVEDRPANGATSAAPRGVSERARAVAGADAASATAIAETAAPTVGPVHPFAIPGAALLEALTAGGPLEPVCLETPGSPADLRLRLPVDERRPLPSDRLIGIVGAEGLDAEPILGEFAIPSIALRTDATVAALLSLEACGTTPEIDYSHALRYWMVVARAVLEMLADQRFIPTLFQRRDSELRAAWHPWLHDDVARAQVGALLSGMPPVVRAVIDEHQGRPWPILDEALRTLTDATVRQALIDDEFEEAVDGHDAAEDGHVAWLQGLLGARSQVVAPSDRTTEMLRDVRGWISELDETVRDRPLRLGVRLSEPPESMLPGDLTVPGDEVRWRLSLHLVGAGDDPVVIDATRIWEDPTAARLAAGSDVSQLEEVLLAELGRASRVYPRLETALREAAPAGIDLLTSEASAFLTEGRGLLEESGFVVFVPEWWGQPSARVGARLQLDAPDLDAAGPLGVSAGGAGTSLLGLNSLVRYSWQVAVGDHRLTTEEFETLRRAAGAGCLVRLRGRWIEWKHEQIADAAALFDTAPGGEMTLLEAIQLAHGARGDQKGLPIAGMDATGWVADLLGASSGDGKMPVLGQPAAFIGALRPYQEVGLSWLAFLDRFGLGACLADDMGLGKTIQLIALLLWEREIAPDRVIGPTLLIVPTSVVANWQRELHRFAPQLSVHVHHGSDRPVGDRFLEIAAERDVVITTYTLISRDRETLLRPAWHRVVLDEAQYIKNPPTKQTATIRALRTGRRIALTGTPVENRLSELWSIMEFCNPGYLGQTGEFRRRFSVPIERHRDQERAEQLRRLVRPFVLRRLKTDPNVITDLPPCVTTKEYATLSSEQAAAYERAVNQMLGQVGRAEGIQRRGLVLATLVKLKQICNHPALVAAVEDPTAPKRKTKKRRRAADIDVDGAGLALLSQRSGKASRLMEMLEEVLATGDKALLFTQFRRMGHLLAAMIQHDLDTEVLFLHGGTPPPKRQQMIDRFQDDDGGVPIFILSLKAGGIGVNLTAANHVFHFDRWWNPAVENQATDRAFRIGQTRTVHVHKFVCMGTLEERIDQMIEQKMELAQNIIGAGEDWLTDLTTVQLRELLTLKSSAMEGES